MLVCIVHVSKVSNFPFLPSMLRMHSRHWVQTRSLSSLHPLSFASLCSEYAHQEMQRTTRKLLHSFLCTCMEEAYRVWGSYCKTSFLKESTTPGKKAKLQWYLSVSLKMPSLPDLPAAVIHRPLPQRSKTVTQSYIIAKNFLLLPSRTGTQRITRLWGSNVAACHSVNVSPIVHHCLVSCAVEPACCTSLMPSVITNLGWLAASSVYSRSITILKHVQPKGSNFLSRAGAIEAEQKTSKIAMYVGAFLRIGPADWQDGVQNFVYQGL